MTPRPFLFAAILAMLVASPAVLAQAPAGPAATPGPVAVHKKYFVLIYSAGSHWDHSKSTREQPGMDRHLAFLDGLWKDGSLIEGGPFLEGGGGLVVLAADTMAGARKISEEDPSLKDGLLTVVIKPWLVTRAR